jgi:hypothetical protein
MARAWNAPRSASSASNRPQRFVVVSQAAISVEDAEWPGAKVAGQRRIRNEKRIQNRFDSRIFE